MHFRAELAQLVSEKEDSVRILRQQLADTKKVNVDLYEKIRIVEGKCRQLEKDMISANKRYHYVNFFSIMKLLKIHGCTISFRLWL